MNPIRSFHSAICLTCTIAASFSFASAARAEMVLSQVIVDVRPDDPSYKDIEVWNNGPERIFVSAQPFEIQSPGTPAERRVENPDPAVAGILVTPQKMVLEPDQRRIIRVSFITPRRDTDRVYRITIKEVSGGIESEKTALKVLLGYDVLAIYRPTTVTGQLFGKRLGRSFLIRNDSNTAQELFDGKQCDATGNNCKALLSSRLYPGATLEQELPYETPVEYSVTFRSGTSLKKF